MTEAGSDPKRADLRRLAKPGRARSPRITLDGQLVTYWDREAARLDALAARALFKWVARGYARKAERARALAARSRAREVARGNLPAPDAGDLRSGDSGSGDSG